MERLRESMMWDSKNTTLLNEQQINELQIKPKLQESTYSINQLIDAGQELKLKLQESDQKVLNSILNKLAETGVKPDFKLWKLPIGKYGNKNGNGRIYTKKLWENIRDNQQAAWKGLAGLADHPVEDNDPGSFRDQSVGWHDMIIGDPDGNGCGIVYGICSFIGPYGHLAQEMLEHGLRVGTSSSGFGDVDKFTKVVNPDTYIIERLADLVLNPSQGTYGDITSTHTAADFMKNIHGSATIEYDQQQVREAGPVQNIARSRIMANAQKFDAVNPDVAAPQVQQPVQPAADNQPPQQKMTESVNMEDKKTTLTKVEEKAFRKYVQSFMDDAKNIDNPIQRLNECIEILECFDEGNCPDLRESLEKQLIEEKTNLEKLVEKVVATEKDYGMSLDEFKQAAERNTAQGLLLAEQVTDYKELCDGLAKRNQQLKEENDKLKKEISLKDKLTEKKIYNTNKEIINRDTELDKISEKIVILSEKNDRLIEKVSKLSLSNKEFERENGLLTNKLNEATNIIKQVKIERVEKLNESKKINNEINRLQKTIKEQDDIISELEENYKAQSKRFDNLKESFDNYKQEVADTYNPIARMMPRVEERVGKYLNLKENKGVEIEAYWNNQVERYGEAILPFEQEIRGAKTLKEATSKFLLHKNQIDPDFQIGSEIADYKFRNTAERTKIYESIGMLNPMKEYEEAPIEVKNEEFLRKLRESGLQ